MLQRCYTIVNQTLSVDYIYIRKYRHMPACLKHISLRGHALYCCFRKLPEVRFIMEETCVGFLFSGCQDAFRITGIADHTICYTCEVHAPKYDPESAYGLL